jgi:hypothetical protein
VTPRPPSPVAASVAFLRIARFDERGVVEQAALKTRLEQRVRLSLAAVPPADRIVLDAEDGVALVHFGDPVRALDLARELCDGPGEEAVQVGLNHGPLAVTGRDADAKVFGDGVASAAAAARFATPGKLFVTSGFAAALEATRPDRAAELAPAGEYTDTRVRLHSLYTPDPERRAARRNRLAAYALAGMLGILILGVAGREAIRKFFPPRPATVFLEVKPRGFVTIDGISHGLAPPLQRIDVPPGRHRIRITAERQPPLEFAVDLAPGEQMTVTHTFGKDAPKVTPGSLWRDMKRRLGLGS